MALNDTTLFIFGGLEFFYKKVELYVVFDINNGPFVYDGFFFTVENPAMPENYSVTYVMH